MILALHRERSSIDGRSFAWLLICRSDPLDRPWVWRCLTPTCGVRELEGQRV
jgi:hypothetical protein